MLVNAGVDLVQGWGRLVDPHTVEVRQERAAAQRRMAPPTLVERMSFWVHAY